MDRGEQIIGGAKTAKRQSKGRQKAELKQLKNRAKAAESESRQLGVRAKIAERQNQNS